MSDLIDRQAAIGTFDCSIGGVPVKYVKYVSEYADKMMSRINALPSAQPDTDRIYAELSKAYNVKGLPDEAIEIIGNLMLSLDE